MRKTLILLMLLPLLGMSKDEIKVKKAALFKNGLGFVTQSGRVKTKDQAYLIRRELPQAMFGTFWFYSPGDRISGVSTYLENEEGTRPLRNSREMFLENNGKRVTLTLNSPIRDESKVEVTGRIEMVNDQELMVRTETSWMVVKLNEIQRFQFLEKPVFEKGKETKEMVLRLDFKNSAEMQDVEMSYLSNRITWLPNYRVALWGDDKATLTLRGMIFNEVADLEDAEISFTVGVPTFKYENKVSPLSNRMAYQEFMGQLGARFPSIYPNYGNGLNIQTNAASPYNNEMYFTSYRDSSFGALGGGNETEGEEGEDLFFYNVKGINLKQGGRGAFDIFKAEVPCEHVYDAQIDPNYATYGFYSRYNTEEQEFQMRDVWHSIRLKNNSEFPWTTGTVLFGKSDQGEFKPLSQDDLKYTPRGGQSFIKLTISPDVMVKDTEREIERTENKKTRNKVKYDLLKIRGEIKLKNYKSKDIVLDIRRQITGMPEKCNVKWNLVSKFREFGRELNERYDVNWDVPLKAGEEKTIEYEYEVYVPK